MRTLAVTINPNQVVASETLTLLDMRGGVQMQPKAHLFHRARFVDLRHAVVVIINHSAIRWSLYAIS